MGRSVSLKGMGEGLNKCVVGKTFDATPESVRPQFREFVERPALQGGTSADFAAKLMREAKLKVSATAITRHRNQTCVCYLGEINE